MSNTVLLLFHLRIRKKMEKPEMAFDYYKRLPRSQQRIYLESDRISSIKLSEPERMDPLIQDLQNALIEEDHLKTEQAAQRLITAIIKPFKIRPLKVKVLEKRPSNTWGELQGLYEPLEGRRADRITVWMRTARRKQVVAFKTFLRTLLHELCHHLDYELIGLRETFHTQGFFKRESSLFHQLVREKKKE
jgi:hypothetical protein